MRGRVGPDRVEELHARMRGLVESARTCEGCDFIQLGRQVFEDRTEEIVLVTVWESLAAIYDWIGSGDLRAHGIPDGESAIFTHVDVQHFETMDIDPVHVPLPDQFMVGTH
jgi:heme-degrading monooxygenase HmoA